MLQWDLMYVLSWTLKKVAKTKKWTFSKMKYYFT